MSELDKEAVLDEFTEAYKKAHGKKPKIEVSNGWYSVDDGKNMRLAQLDEWTTELKNGGSKAAKKNTSSTKSAKSEKSTKSAKKSTTKKSTAKKTTAKKSASKATKKSASSGKKPAQRKSEQSAAQTPAQAWLTHLQKQAGSSRLPRGFKA